jgi:hypothetical protein
MGLKLDVRLCKDGLQSSPVGAAMLGGKTSEVLHKMRPGSVCSLGSCHDLRAEQFPRLAFIDPVWFYIQHQDPHHGEYAAQLSLRWRAACLLPPSGRDETGENASSTILPVTSESDAGDRDARISVLDPIEEPGKMVSH